MKAVVDGRLRFLWRWVPGLVLLAACAWWLMPLETPLHSIGLYALAFAWSVVLPGTLVHRALRGRPTTLVADVAFGGATGLVLQLLAWAGLTVLGVAQWLVFWPVPVVLAFALIPSLRRHWTLARYDRALHPTTSWAIVLAAMIAVYGAFRTSSATSVLPPAASSWYQDSYWHLSIAAETMRAFPPEMPQIAGRAFSYHWFANAHIGAMTWTTGLDLPLVFSRLWVAPIIVLAVMGIAAAGQRLTGRAWPGALAALMAAAGAVIQPAWFGVYGVTSFNSLSPSQQFSLPLMTLALAPLIDALRGIRLRWGSWLLLALATLGVSGAKASVIPVLVCGLLLALVVALIANRGLLRPVAIALAVVGVVGALTWPLVAGGGSGVRLQLFATIRALDPWVRFSGVPVAGGIALGPLPPGIERQGGVILLILLLVAYGIAYLWLLAGLPALGKSDLSGWMLLGVGIAGFGAMMLINQDGLSQVYFMSGAIIAWHLLAAWGVKLLIDKAAVRSSGWTIASAIVLGLCAGYAAASTIRNITGPYRGAEHLNRTLVISFSCVAAAVGVWLVLAFLARRRPAARHVVPVVGVMALIGAAIPTWHLATIAQFVGQLNPTQGASTMLVGAIVCGLLGLAGVIWFGGARPSDPQPEFPQWIKIVPATALAGVVLVSISTPVVDPNRPPPTASPGRIVQSTEATAALWLRDTTDRFAIVASNVHCLAKRTAPNCDARAYWVGAFSERRILVEGWGYTAAAHEAHGRGGRTYSQQPFEDPDLFALNEAAFYAPTPEVLSRLRARGVSYLFANSLAGPVSPRLGELAPPVFVSGPVTIHKLEP